MYNVFICLNKITNNYLQLTTTTITTYYLLLLPYGLLFDMKHLLFKLPLGKVKRIGTYIT